jgi:hypothetical protein
VTRTRGLPLGGVSALTGYEFLSWGEATAAHS